MPELFDKTCIGSIELPNRAIRSATWSGTGDDRGYVTDNAVNFYRTLGSGGIGLIICGYQYILPNGIQLPYMIGNYEDAQIEGLRRLASAVHTEGGRIIPQIVHAGARADSKLFREGDEVWTPSAMSDSVPDNTSKEVTKTEIRQLIEAYAAAAVRSKAAGFDGVQLHGAHGYGINQFLSGAWNKRSDAYGGSIKNRYRFLGEVLEAVRGGVGDGFPVLIKLNGHDYVEGGLVPEESLEIAKRLADDGIDAIEVSGGSSASPKDLGPVRKISRQGNEAYFSDIAQFFKNNIRVPIITVGGIRSLKVMNDIFNDGKADCAAMARPFIREPDLVNRWQSGDTRPATCISCNGCFETGLQGTGISCKVLNKKSRKDD